MRLRVLSPLGFAIALLLAVFAYVIHTTHATRLEEVRVQTAERAGALLRTELANYTDVMSSALEALTRDRSLAHAMRTGDRDALLAEGEPIFETLRAQFQIEHFYFHTPDRVNLLRLHEPDHSGDLIDRVSLQTAQRTGLPSSGIEQGPTGNCTLRVVYPWRHDGALIGYMELGTEFEAVAGRVHDLLHVDLLVVVDKALLKRDRWESRNAKLGRQSAWDAFPDVVLIESTMPSLPAAIRASLAGDPGARPFTLRADGRSTQVVSLPLTDARDVRLGSVVVLSDTTAIEAHSTRSLAVVSAVGLAVGAAVLLFFYYFLGRVGRELDVRAARLAEANETLERRVEERTHALDGRNRDMRLVLDHVGDGFLTLDREGHVRPERSAIVDAWLGTAAPGATFADYLAPFDPEAAAWFELAWSAVVDDVLPLEVAMAQLPRQMRHGDRFYTLGFTPIMAGSALASVLVVIVDVTSEVERQRSEEAARDIVTILEHVVADRPGFLDFLGEATELVELVAADTAPLAQIKRAVHTLKGNCGLFALTSIAGACERIENGMAERDGRPDPADVEQLRGLWARLRRALDAVVHERSRERVEVERRELEALVAAITGGEPRGDLARRASQLSLAPTARRLDHLCEQGRALAARVGKPGVQFVAEDNGVRLDSELWASFWSSFVHVIRNAVDHGIEQPSQRRASGKSGPGTIVLRTAVRGADLVVEIDDDGRGIDLENVAEQARSAGLAHASAADLVQALFSDGLSTKAEATELSGRGVGLGAVRAECAARGGTASVHTSRGVGTRIELRFPVAAMDASRKPPARRSLPSPPVHA